MRDVVVICSDGRIRHDRSFRSIRAARRWVTWRHVWRDWCRHHHFVELSGPSTEYGGVDAGAAGADQPTPQPAGVGGPDPQAGTGASLARSTPTPVPASIFRGDLRGKIRAARSDVNGDSQSRGRAALEVVE